jgi:hypothetical protein
MDAEQWYSRRDDRTRRYAGRVLSPNRSILLKLSPDSSRRYDGQVSAIVAANLLARMTPAVAVAVPDVDIVPPLPWAGITLRKHLIEVMFGADPNGRFQIRNERDGDYVLDFGTTGESTVHGSGWNAFVGSGASPLPLSDQPNPVGPGLAAIIAVARLFGSNLGKIDGPYVFNGFNWQSNVLFDDAFPGIGHLADLGSIWSIGLGSVGTAALYFLQHSSIWIT